MSKGKKISKGEKATKDIIEEIFDLEFVNVRPKFMSNPETGRNLELDCYNSYLKLALEYNGKQHYEYTEKFHKCNIQNFYNQQQRDELKSYLCKKNGIDLIVVPYYEDDKESYILMELLKLKYHQYVIKHVARNMDKYIIDCNNPQFIYKLSIFGYIPPIVKYIDKYYDLCNLRCDELKILSKLMCISIPKRKNDMIINIRSKIWNI